MFATNVDHMTKHTRVTRSALAVGLGLLLVSQILAQGSPKLAITIIDEKVNQTSEERAGQSAVTITPGDTMRYILTAANTGDAVMKNPSIVDPIPAGVEYIPLSATGANAKIQFSIDGGKTYSNWPVEYQFTNPAGKKVKKQATADMITHVKWDIKARIQPNTSRELSFQVVVK